MQNKVFLCFPALAAVVLLAGSALAQQRFNVTLNTIQEVPPAVASSGRGTCQVTLNLAQTQITVTCSFSNLTTGVISGHIHGNAPPGQNAPVLIDLTPPLGSTSGSFTRGPFTITAAQLAEMRAKRWYINIHTNTYQGGEIRGQIKQANTIADVDGDGRTDITVFRQSDNTFYSLNSIDNNFTVYRFGSGSGDLILNSIANDFDGDGRYDPLIIKLVPALATDSPIYWSMVQTGSNTLRTVLWGNLATANNEAFVPADYDGDGRTDIAVYRRSEGRYYIIESSTNTIRVIFWGAPGDLGVVGDFDGDGRSDPTIVRAVGDQFVWHSLLSSNGQLSTAYWGASETDAITTRIPLDFDGDGRQDRVTRRPVGGQLLFCILRSSDNQQMYITYGLAAENLLFGDYDGDGKTDIVRRRDVGGVLTWFIWQSSNQQTRTVQFGITNDQ